MDGDVPLRPSYGEYISQVIISARVCSHVEDVYARNKCLTANFLNRVIGTISLERLFPSSIADTMNWFQNLNVGLKSLLHQGLSEPEFYGDLVYKFKKIMGRTDLFDQF